MTTGHQMRPLLQAVLAAGFALLSLHPQGAPPPPSSATQDLFAAVKANDLKKASEAIARGADADAPGKGGMTPLHLAAIKGEKEMAWLLLEKGARANARDDAGMTPLHIAAFEGQTGVGELLLFRGADPNSLDAQGYTPLQYARANGKSDVAAILAPRPPQARVITDEALGAASGDSRGFNSYAAPPPPEDIPPPEIPVSAGPRPSDREQCLERVKALERRRQELLSKNSNFDWVDKEKVKAEIQEEEKNCNPATSRREEYWNQVDAGKARIQHDEKMRRLHKLDNAEKEYTPEAEKELRDLEIEINNTRVACDQIPLR